MPFNIINESSLYRSPLRLLEALEGEAKKSWDLGYHHAKRGETYNDSGADDKKHYKIGFEAINSRQSTTKSQPPPAKYHSYKSKPISIDRSPVRGEPKGMTPAGWGIPDDILDNRMDDALGRTYDWDKKHHIAPKVKTNDEGKLEIDPNDSIEIIEQKQKLLGARDEMMARDQSKYQIRDFIGAGAAGAVFEGPDEPDGMPTVFKFDNGPYEARIADAVMTAGLSGKNGLSILPRYISTDLTSYKMTKAKLPLFVIHREDLANIKDTIPKEGSDFLGSVGNLITMISDAAKHTMKIRTERNLKPEEKFGIKEILGILDEEEESLHNRAMGGGPQLKKQWPKMMEEIRTLIKHGIIPCDIHADNWGIRKGTGEIVMRDVGCTVAIPD
jgi:hypothetical protein